ncbi:MAG: peptidylprolyl isomerase, partial [Thermoanaerobaculia bacterium]
QALEARAEGVDEERDAIALALATLAEAGEYLVRREAAAALTKLGVEAPPVGEVEAGGTVETYSDLVRRARVERYVRLTTERGDVDLALACPEAPRTCLNFLQLANQGFFDGLTFHRVIPDFVVQAGDPRGDGIGGPGYAIRDEPNLLRYERGVLGMALSGPDTGGSQFFITLSAQPHLDATYTAFGRVAAGEEVLDAIEQGDAILTAVEIDAPGGHPLQPPRRP